MNSNWTVLIKISKRFEKLIMKKNSLWNLIIHAHAKHLIKIVSNYNFPQTHCIITSYHAFRSISSIEKLLADNFSAHCFKMLYE